MAEMLSAITRDTRLEFALVALDLAQEALQEALDLTTELQSGYVPDVIGLDDKISSALDAIDEVASDNFSVVTSNKMMSYVIRQVEAAKRPTRKK
ncbi:hypothetical protein [Dyella telluris]|uniref:Uncharacterized protein n=1 Tax=Dyella telluris TaxID=2763498 RepID=A0A7G8Q7Y0_9GAMM|nr:hypothetical protein [Dyella telluris]QNK02888.1 hypothetical protein H8F01_07145 [Dyella telluris]